MKCIFISTKVAEDFKGFREIGFDFNGVSVIIRPKGIESYRGDDGRMNYMLTGLNVVSFAGKRIEETPLVLINPQVCVPHMIPIAIQEGGRLVAAFKQSVCAFVDTETHLWRDTYSEIINAGAKGTPTQLSLRLGSKGEVLDFAFGSDTVSGLPETLPVDEDGEPVEFSTLGISLGTGSILS